MIPNFWKNKRNGVLMYFFILLSFCASVSVFSQSNADQKELDQVLRNELGVSDGKTKPEPQNQGQPSPAKEESRDAEPNLIQERYNDQSDDSPSATWILVKILFVLFILVGAGYYLVIKMQATKSAKYPVKGFMKVLSSLSLSPNQSLQIVEVGNRLLVVGVADGSVSLISEINSQEEKSQILKLKEEADPYVPNFLETMLESLQSKALSKKIRINKNSFESNSDAHLEIQTKARESLDRLRKHREMLEGGQS